MSRFALTGVTPAAAQGKQRNLAERCAKEDFAKSNPKTCAQYAKPAEEAKQPEQPSRPDFTADDQAVAIIPGIPDARFWADSEKDFLAALPATPGPWLALSTGGGDGAFGAGLLNGWSESGKRPEFSVVTGVSTGALMAPYAFVGPAQDPGLKRAYTEYNAGDIFEDVKTPESLVDTWPLKRLIGKEVTPELLAQVAEAHKRGRRLFVATTNLDAQRGVVWNMGAIAAKGDEAVAGALPQCAARFDRDPRPVPSGPDRRRGERQEDAGDARRRRARRTDLRRARSRCSTRRAPPSCRRPSST